VPVDLRGTPFSSFKTGDIQANGLRFHYVEVGEGPLALCLHGWPDSPYTYRYLLPILARAGYRAVAPFMRGFHPTEIPKSLTTTKDLAGDVAGLHQAFGGDKDAVLVGHDWGAVASYAGAVAEPERWRRVVILNVPPLAMIEKMMFYYAQNQREFYWWFHQMEISNHVVPLNDFAYVDGIWGDWSPGYDATEELPYAKACIRPPGHLEATLGYYRTTFNYKTFASPEHLEEQGQTWGRPLPQPTLYLHGARDGLFPLPSSKFRRKSHRISAQVLKRDDPWCRSLHAR
jgi:pimeloyl-ACP methyl ester carboxylesterase